jgi:hypothetical protein
MKTIAEMKAELEQLVDPHDTLVESMSSAVARSMLEMIGQLAPVDYSSLLRAIFSGWCDKNNAPEEERGCDELGQRKPDEHFFIPHTSTEEEAQLLSLFSHWSNDLLCIAASFGVTMEYEPEKGFYVGDADPKPEGNYYYSPGEMQWDDGRYLWQPGEWIKVEEELAEESAPGILEGK